MDKKQDGRQAIIEANLSKSQPTIPQSSEGSSSTPTVEVTEENEGRLFEERWEDADSLEEQDFLAGSQFHVKSVTEHDVVRTHAVPIFNVVSNRAVPPADQTSESHWSNPISNQRKDTTTTKPPKSKSFLDLSKKFLLSNQWKVATTIKPPKSKSFLDLSRKFLLYLTGEEPKRNENFGAVNVGKSYNGIETSEYIDGYAQLIANQQRREPLVVYALKLDPRTSTVASEVPQEGRITRSRGEVGSWNDVLLPQTRKQAPKLKAPLQG